MASNPQLLNPGSQQQPLPNMVAPSSAPGFSLPNMPPTQQQSSQQQQMPMIPLNGFLPSMLPNSLINPAVNLAASPAAGGLSALQLLSLLPFAQPPQLYPQHAQLPAHAKIELSAANDVAFATRLREAKRAGESYHFAVERLVMWKDYFIDRLENILALFDPREGLGTASRASKRPRSISSSPEPSARAAVQQKQAYPLRVNGVSGLRTRSPSTRKRPRRYDDGAGDESEPEYSASKSQESNKAAPTPRRRGVFIRNSGQEDIPIAISEVVGDKIQRYLDTDEHGSSGQMLTRGDLDAMAGWIAKQSYWHGYGSETQWKAFGRLYQQRSYISWRQAYTTRKGDITQRVVKLRALSTHEGNDEEEVQSPHGEQFTAHEYSEDGVEANDAFGDGA
ncbi:hypothetical protein K488DRAFT_86380 [Vararia minispora EC-137]|uniref:Uncharacterized protein n=1 Tax=Vararia minispora EC-137 TaxID=1314806 RepID=A0ACB8QJX4_9AGAM|nr:hypothetical protein K488DRAFT_86380 [Vararia minispora EC-137]